jgi:integrase
MSRQRITPGTVGPVAVVPLALDDEGTEVVIPKPVVDGEEREYPRGLKVGQPVKIETPHGILEFVPTRWRGLARSVDVDGTTHMSRRWRGTRAAAEAATTRAGEQWLASRTAGRTKAAASAAAEADGDVTTTVGDLVRVALDGPGVARLKDGTQQDYQDVVPYIVGHPIAAMLPRDVGVSDVKALLLAVAHDHGSSTAKNAKAILNHALNLAVEDRRMHVPMNPGKHIEKGAIPTVIVRESKLDHTLAPSNDEVEQLLRQLHADPEAGPMIGPRKVSKAAGRHINGKDIADLVTFIFATGCRRGEASAVRWSDLDLTETVTVRTNGGRVVMFGSVRIDGTVRTLKGVGTVRQERTGDQPGTKNETSDRHVPLAADVVQVLRDRAAVFGIDLANPSATPVFGSPQFPDRFRDQRGLSRAIATLFDKHGLEYARAHAGRKWRVTSLYEQGVALHKIADFVGHKTLSVTAGYLGKRRQMDDDVLAVL